MFRLNPINQRLSAWLVCGMLLLLPALASAVTVRWTFANVTFDDGGTASGFFLHDASTGTFGARSVSVAGGDPANFPALTYANQNSIASINAGLGNSQATIVFTLNSTNRQLRFTPSRDLTDEGGTVPINLNTAYSGSGSIECFNCGPSRRIVSGNLVGTPDGADFVITPVMAGNWYDPAQDGHGVQIEVLPGGIATAFWFTFDNAGNQVWINGAGSIQGNRVVMPSGRVLNGRFPPNFNPATLERRSWGTMTFSFTDCNHGTLTWTSTDASFTPSGTMALTRLTSLAGLGCL